MRSRVFWHILILLLVVSGSGCDQIMEERTKLQTQIRRINFHQLQERNDLFYLPDDEHPFSGMVYEFWPNGTKASEALLTNGKLNGLARCWYENGRPMLEILYRDNRMIYRKQWDRQGRSRHEGRF